MQLKPYQQDVLADLATYADQLTLGGSLAASFARYWQHHDPPLTPAPGQTVTPYHEAAVPGVPHVCVKVPTGGGKTLLACHALGTLLGQAPLGRPRLAVWLVPSLTILDQTLRALRDPRHPYGQALRTLFRHVEVIDKAGLAQGQGLLDAASGEQLTVAVLSFDSLRATNKENRKNYQMNSAHQPLVSALGGEGPGPLPDTDATATINALRKLEPVVIVDEAHNATTALSTEMLRNLAPAFVLEFTATPGPQANIISFVSAQALKAEQMVKLPVVVYNHHDKEDVINNALRLRARLETLALAAQRKSGALPVRPIVLFQAQPRNAAEAADPTTYRKLKQDLLKLGIAEEQIKIKTGDLDELGTTDLLAPGCPVRFIITVNALKEGWDCSFAYILASLANRSSPVEVEQLVGRVLRQPRATRHPVALLNMSYVLTASAQFDATLKHIVAGLNQAGFSQDDFRAEAAPAAAEPIAPAPGTQTALALEPAATPLASPTALDATRLQPAPALPTEAAIEAAEAELTPAGALAPEAAEAALASPAAPAEAPDDTAAVEAAALAAAATAAAHAHAATTEAYQQVKTYPMRPAVAEVGQRLRLPYFVRPTPGLYAQPELLDRGDLLTSFDLAAQRINLSFDALPPDLWQIDVEQQEHGYAPRLQKPNTHLRQELLAVFENTSPAGQRRAVVKELTRLLSQRQHTISDGKLKTYLERVFEHATPARLREAKERPEAYAQVVRRFIGEVQTAHALEEFDVQLRSNELVAGLPYSLPKRRAVARAANPLAQSLYEQEENGNSLEIEMMTLLAGAANLTFWTRNPSQPKSGFRLNGPVLNHYPDFIAQTQKGHVLLIETKGDDRDNSDSAAKIRLGQAWEKAANRPWEGSSASAYHYFMVFKLAGLPGAVSLAKFGEQLARL